MRREVVCQGQQQPEGGSHNRGHSEIYDGLPRALAIGEFGCAHYGENQGEQQTGY